MFLCKLNRISEGNLDRTVRQKSFTVTSIHKYSHNENSERSSFCEYIYCDLS